MTTISFRAAVGLLSLSMLLASCSGLSPESRLRAKLLEAGLSPHMAGCMAERMASRLSIDQLRKLQSIASLRKSHSEKLSKDEWLYKLRALDDPEISRVTSKAVLKCSL
ncbi:hypothetical protein MOK15_01210 [Sphingobium sp. BYY-5]|uniref:hypothetical protein n=1 Tax=Sphingobium sp. BYY-5 TaxID=2926400 RepID=UPI001FA77246|nr:hypothetical protein [Sphingobium sp. BYY-5]MCI4588726.1 hypothetical protein [Sphingobium sp. BYY-5]